MAYGSSSNGDELPQRNGSYTSSYMISTDNGNSFDEPYSDNVDERIHSLRKSIREQTILLSVLDSNARVDDRGGDTIDDLKTKIRRVCKEFKTARSSSNQQQAWIRYELNMRRLQDLTDEGRALKKEIDYLVDTGLQNVQAELVVETDRLARLELELARIRNSDGDPVRAKAHAMIASKLNAPLANDVNNAQLEGNAQERRQHIDNITHGIERLQQDARQVLQLDLPVMDTYLDLNRKQNRDRQMFEKGLFVSEQLARFIDTVESDTSNNTNSDSAMLATSPLSYHQPKPKSAPTIVGVDEDYISYNPSAHPPPVPTTQRPGSPRSAVDIKAEAQRRIEQRRLLFVNKYNQQRSSENLRRSSTKSDDSNISQDEKAAQERLRKAETEARERLQNAREQRAKARQEIEEKRKQEAAARESRQREQEQQRQWEEEQMRKEQEARAKKRRKEEAEALERRRKEIEEHERREREVALKREEEEKAAEEARLQRIRQAAERAAREKRLRQEEVERKEREREAARTEAENRRREWLETEENRRKQKEAAKREQEEREQKEKEEEERRKQQVVEEQRRKQQEEEAIAAAAAQAEAEAKAKAEAEAAMQIEPPQVTAQQTAGTSGYGVDIEDEVDFSTIYRVKSLYEYRGARSDDLSFGEDEIIKAHPHKESQSDWWYGTSLSTKQVGFFPRAYVEIVEEAFRVRALYEFVKTREDDLAFAENEIIVVQPFQDDGSDWWYGTSEDSGNAGYFPKSYVDIINPGVPSIQLSEAAAVTSPVTSQPTDVQDEPQRGMSAPNTPIMKKETLTVSRTETGRRRRATSNVGIPGSNDVPIGRARAMSVPTSRPTSPGLLTWASTMEKTELEAIPAEERKRQETIFELIATEKTYLRDLQLVVSVFYADSGKYLTRDEQDVVFSNIDELLLCNTALLSDLESRQQESAGVISNIGDVFLKHAENLNCYSTYCRNQSFASRFLQDKRQQDQWFDVFLKTAQSRPECRSLDLSHFLLEPMQRITRYPLLLQNILQATPKRHPDYGVLRSALFKAEAILQHVNEETRRYENSQKMRELSRLLDMEHYGRLDVSSREFVMEGVLYKAKSGRKLHGYLFNDILILTEPLKALSSEGYLYRLYKEPMSVDMITVRQQHQNLSLKASFTSSTSSSSTDDNAFQIVYGSHVIGVKASSASQKRQWISQIQHFSALQSTIQRQQSTFY
ncbi:hypothetical protein BDB00DRAFT_441263 [Zychaea mexicana]|uniref:uncharacterized protein n=1 Tax=Zychaea mexicana TaxID=64656 RepID=UPI0022FE9646|nr:uncharacterized protein BDB00DRAFT_441263 [Zychaea mexicana]KAI9492304.1 hypothetical protein BDB00DRAFT_441263 [Zychaea mexicana]